MPQNGSLTVMENLSAQTMPHATIQPPDLVKNLYQDLRMSASMIAGLEAIANKALDDGESTIETLEHIALIAAKVRQDISNASIAVAELNGAH